MDDTVPLYSQESIQKMEYPGPGTAFSAPPAMPINANLPLLIGPDNVVTTCPHCQTAVRTSIKYTATTRTHITALLCSFICCCCCLPYCMTSTRNTDHYCPSCFKYLGTYQK